MVVSFCIKDPLDFTRVHQIESPLKGKQTATLKFPRFLAEYYHKIQV